MDNTLIGLKSSVNIDLKFKKQLNNKISFIHRVLRGFKLWKVARKNQQIFY